MIDEKTIKQWNSLHKRFVFYYNWFKVIEHDAFICNWVKERMKIFHDLMTEIERDIPYRSNPFGNYKNEALEKLNKNT